MNIDTENSNTIHIKKDLRFIYKRFYIKNFLVLLIASCLPVLLLGLLTFQITQTYIKQELDKTNQNLLVQTRNNMEMIIDDISAINLIFSANPEMIRMLKHAVDYTQVSSNVILFNNIIKNFLVTTAASLPYIHSIYIYTDNPEENFISSNNGVESLNESHDTDWYNSYQNDEENRAFWSERRTIRQYDFESDATEVLTFFARFYSGSGLVVLNLYKTFFEKQITELDLYDDQIIMVVDKDNNIILGNNDNKILQVNVIEKSVHITGSSTIKIGKSEYIVNKINSQTFHWDYISATPVSSLYTVSRHMGKSVMIILMILILACVVLTMIITRQNFRGIKIIVDMLEDTDLFYMNELQRKPCSDLIIQNIIKKLLERRQLENEVKENALRIQILELKALQTQVTPHFLVNTLKAIFWMSFETTKSNNEVCKMIENLTSILYYSMKNDGSLVSLKDEVKYTKDYIAIEKNCHNNKFEVYWSYPESIMDCLTIRMLIQPLIENAIIHGFINMKVNCRIDIMIQEDLDMLNLTVSDNGTGIDQKKLIKINELLRSNQEIVDHIGLCNNYKRLKHQFGEESELTVQSEKEKGTTISVRFPRLKIDTKKQEQPYHK